MPDQIRKHNSPDESITAHPGSNVNKTWIHVSERGATLLAVSLAIGLAGYAAARVESLKDHIDENQKITQNEIDHYRDDFAKLDRQYRMTELKLDDWTVVAHRAGIVLPSDYARGPQGNPDSQSFNIKPKGK